LLHDTYGFPIDLTLEIAEEAGLTVDRDGFKALMAEQRDRAKADAREKKLGGTDLSVYSGFRAKGETKFTGYEELETESRVIGLISDGREVGKANSGEIVEVILGETSFYAESGGQDSDAGVIVGDGFELEVLDVQKPIKGLISHKAILRSGSIEIGAKALTQVDADWRVGACQAHSGTHVMHAALREVLGPNALQSGSYNKPGYLRLDFSWTSALSPETRSELEEVANLAIRRDLPVKAQFMSLADAKAWGAVALFGETYDESVRVIEVGGPWSRELCGGTHVSHSSQIGLISLINETSVGSGSRRVEALVGIEAFRSLAQERAIIARLTDSFKVSKDSLEERIAGLSEDLKSTQKKLAAFEAERLAQRIPELISANSTSVGSYKLISSNLGELASIDDVRSIVTQIRDRVQAEAAVIAILAVVNEKPAVVIATTEGARSAGAKAGLLVREASTVLGGGGGGKDDIAQGGGQNVAAINDALSAIAKALVS
jgi:alanyl-tRNA synthetase